MDTQNQLLSDKYLKEAAINGSEEAQYDYAMKLIKDNKSVEGLAWLLEASSMANEHADRALYDIFLDGTPDGTIKPKLEKAMTYAERLKDAGYPENEDLIQEVKKRMAEAQNANHK